MYDAGTILNKVLDRLLTFFYPSYWDERFPSALSVDFGTGDQIILSWTNNGDPDFDRIIIERSVDDGAWLFLDESPPVAFSYIDDFSAYIDSVDYRIRYQRGGAYSEYSNIAGVSWAQYWATLKAIVSELTNSEALVTEDGLIIIQEA